MYTIQYENRILNLNNVDFVRWKLLWTFILEAKKKKDEDRNFTFSYLNGCFIRHRKLILECWTGVHLFLFGLFYIIYGRYNETTKEKNEPRNWKKKKRKIQDTPAFLICCYSRVWIETAFFTLWYTCSVFLLLDVIKWTILLIIKEERIISISDMVSVLCTHTHTFYRTLTIILLE